MTQDVEVDPTNIPTTFTREQTEDFVVFGILVANKEAKQTRDKLSLLYKCLLAKRLMPLQDTTPFKLIRAAADKVCLRELLEEVKVGQYTRIEKALTEVSQLDATALTVAALEAVHGIGPKTARFIALYALPGQEVAPLDTHILKFLRTKGYADVPKSTPPSGPTYDRLEKAFIAEAHKAGLSVKELDTQVWKSYARRSGRSSTSAASSSPSSATGRLPTTSAGWRTTPKPRMFLYNLPPASPRRLRTTSRRRSSKRMLPP